MFVEALDTLKAINVHYIPVDVRGKYYEFCGRCYYEREDK